MTPPVRPRDPYLDAAEEASFEDWYANTARPAASKAGVELDPNPDSPLHFYDWRSAHHAGVLPDAEGHWPSEYKRLGHDNLIVDGMDTRNGQPATQALADSSRRARLQADPYMLAAETAFAPDRPMATPSPRARSSWRTPEDLQAAAAAEQLPPGASPKPLPLPSRLMSAAMGGTVVGTEGAIASVGEAVRQYGAGEAGPTPFKEGIRPPTPRRPSVEQAGRTIAAGARERMSQLPRPETGILDKDATIEQRLEAAAFGVGQGIASTAPAVAGAALAGPAGAMAGGGVMFLQNQDEVRQSLLEQGVDEARADKISGIAAVPISALDLLGIGGLVGAMRKRAQKWAITRILASIAEGGVAEGLTETAQSALGQSIVQAVTGKKISWRQAFEEGLVGSLTGGGIAGVTTGVQKAAEIGQPSGSVDPYVAAAEAAGAKPSIRERIADAINPRGAEERRTAQRAAETDPLTGVGNRAAFERARATADADPNTEVVVFDLNNLKAANDLVGHKAGDDAITQASVAIARAAAEAGVPERVFRIGGDELVAIVPKGAGEKVRGRAESIYGGRPAGDFEVSLSGSSGPTFVDADTKLQAAKEARKGGASYRDLKTSAPTGITRMRTDDLFTDPDRLQYKQLGPEGVSSELKGVSKYNERLGGVLTIWRDPADGKYYVVNGHHRHELAKRTGHPELNVQIIEAKDAAEARAIGAIINIAEGRGTATDVAKFLRDTGKTTDDLQAEGVSVRGDLARSGVALSKLASDIFDQVATGKMPQGWGVAIGELLDDPVLQREALKAARTGKRLSQSEVTEIARQVRDAGTEALTQETLFGTETERHGLFVQKAQLAATIKKRIGTDKRTFGYVAKEGRAEQLSEAGNTTIDVEAARNLAERSARAEEMFDRLYTRSGPIADLMNAGARRIAHGEAPSAVANDIYPAIGDAVGREISGGAEPGVPGSREERSVSEGSRTVADEIAADDAAREGRVADSTDETQSGLFSPRRPPPPKLESPTPPGDPRRSRPLRVGDPIEGYTGISGDVLKPLDQYSETELWSLQKKIHDRSRAAHVPQHAREAAMADATRMREFIMERRKSLPLPEDAEHTADGDILVRGERAAASDAAHRKAAIDKVVHEEEIRAGKEMLTYQPGPNDPIFVGVTDRTRLGLPQEGDVTLSEYQKAASRPSSEVVDDVTAKRLGMPKDLQNDINLLAEERAHVRAVSAPGAMVRIRETGEVGRVVEGTVYEREGSGRISVEREAPGGNLYSSHTPAELEPVEAGPALRLTAEPEGPGQASMFGAKEGTASARNLAQTEAAARSELDVLQTRIKGEADPGRRQALAAQISALERLVNRDKAISAKELATRAAAEAPSSPSGPLSRVPVHRPTDVSRSTRSTDEATGQPKDQQTLEPVSQPTGTGRETPVSDSLRELPAPPGPERVAQLERLYGTDEALKVVKESLDDPATLPDGGAAARCTDCASYIVDQEGEGRVVGYAEGTNPTETATGAKEADRTNDGHDFAIIDERYIVDEWVKETSAQSKRAVFDLENPVDVVEVRKLYGDPATWEELNDRRRGDLPDGIEPIVDKVTRPTEPNQTVSLNGPDQIELLSPQHQSGPLAGRLQKLSGVSPAVTKEVQALIDISRKLAEAVNVPLRQGRFNAAARKALGVFSPKAEVTRVVRYDMLDTVAHEVGHYISKKYLRNPTMRSNARGAGPAPTPLPKAAGRELVKMGRDLYGTRQPAAGYGEEGIAEWVSFYVTDPAGMLQKAPVFTAHMDSVLAGEPALRAALDQARDDFARYQASPPSQRIAAMLSVGETVRARPTLRMLMTAWLDDLSEFRLAVRELGGSTNPTDDAYVLARLTRGNAGAADEMIRRGVTKFGTDQRVAPSVKETLRSIKPERVQAFREYLTAESALERWEHGIDPGITKKDAADVAEAGRAEFQQAAQALWQHGQALIDYRVDAGLLTAEEGTAIKAKNQRRVGFYRVFDPDETASGKGYGKGFSRNSSGVKRQKGSARRIVDPLENIIKDTYETVAQARKYDVMRTLVGMAKSVEGGGRIIEEVPAPQRPVSIPLEKIQEQLAEMGLVYEGVDAKTGKKFTAQLGGPGGAQLEGIVRAFEDARVPGPAESKDLVVPLIEDGERKWYALRDRKLYDAVQGLGAQEMTTMVRWLSLPTRTLRAGATLTLEFIGRNPVRDAWSSAIYSKAGFRPPGWRLSEGLFHYLKADDVFQRWALNGGDNAAMLGLDRPMTQRSLRQLLASRTARAASVVLHPIDTLRMVSSVMENATRVGEFAAIERRARRQGASPDAAGVEAALAARDVSLDFAQAGTASRAINSIVAFFNASVRGTAQLARELRDRPHVIVPRAVAAITIPSLILASLQDDDPVYQDVPRWVKDVSWVYVQRGTDRSEGWDGYGSGKVERVWMLPKPFELGVLFGTVPERILEWLKTEKPEALTSARDLVLKAFAPPVVPTAIVPLIENFANRSMFRDRPIVPRSREALVPSEQTAPNTGETAKLVGRLVDYSPAKIENLIRGYGGGLGRYATDALDVVIRQGRAAAGLPPVSKPAPDFERDALSALPLLRGFSREAPAEDSESIEQLYKRFERNERMRQTWRRMLTEGRGREAAGYFEDHKPDILSVATSEELGVGRMGPLRAAYREIQELQDVKRKAQQAGREDLRKPIVETMRKVAQVAEKQE